MLAFIYNKKLKQIVEASAISLLPSVNTIPGFSIYSFSQVN